MMKKQTRLWDPTEVVQNSAVCNGNQGGERNACNTSGQAAGMHLPEPGANDPLKELEGFAQLCISAREDHSSGCTFCLSRLGIWTPQRHIKFLSQRYCNVGNILTYTRRLFLSIKPNYSFSREPNASMFFRWWLGRPIRQSGDERSGMLRTVDEL